MEPSELRAEELQTIVLGIFREICAYFQPMMASEAILSTSAAAIRKRIDKARLPKGATMSKTPTLRQISCESCDSKEGMAAV
mmetsp:Transcript_95552/g.256595  ORF Transcript_95552/g.256595 Transcript_95552/m.256595 type:complete len:82 (-) Transcript_95552:167-412(-)